MGYRALYNAMSRTMQPAKPPKIKKELYLVVNGQQAGPFTKTELERLVKSGTLTAETLAWETGMPAWVPAGTIPQLNKLLILYTPKRKEEAKASSLPAKQPQTIQPEHPLRADLIGAMSQLGFKGPDVVKSIDALLQAQPDISSSDALKQLLAK